MKTCMHETLKVLGLLRQVEWSEMSSVRVFVSLCVAVQS